ncbi:MAG: type II toxin-antitoxin system HicA family toxin [Candidatus Diapherotrites archaeon]
MKLPVVSGKEMIKFLQSKGFSIARQKGSHVSLYKKTSEGNLIVVVPIKKAIKPGTLLSILKQSKTIRKELIEHLR